MDMKAMYSRRSAQFLKEIRPYLHYAIQSVVLSLVAVFLLSSVGYKVLLQSVDERFPWQPLCTAAMLLPLAGGSIRTYLREADMLFLLPYERGMASYLQAAMRRAMLLQFLLVIVVWLLVWPLYAKMTGAGLLHFAGLLLLWCLLKFVLLTGKWTELQLLESGTRRWFALLRWGLAGLAAYVLLASGLLPGLFTVSAGSLLYLGLLRLPRNYTVNWSLLMDWEKRHRARIYRVLNWFIDVPQVQDKARNFRLPRTWLKAIPFRQDASYHYMYTLVWLRSELFGITLRLTLLGMVLLVFIRNDWAAAIVYIVFALFSALQLSELKRYYRDHIWHAIYPLQQGLWKRSVGTVCFCIHLGVLLLLAIPLAAHLTEPLWAAGLLLTSAILSRLFYRYR
ncbi:ABC transporter permease [Paenibacillus sp. y28]|uniref:ABC transporter permease n=1 Tax=Paenibacillus sp. y28 TaxID=3129110 RepID=UPI0030192806